MPQCRLPRYPLLAALTLLAALLLTASPALAEWGDCDACHHGGGGGAGGFPYGVCAHCHHVIDFGPFHDPEDPGLVCANCHGPSGLHVTHPWAEACAECHMPAHIHGPHLFDAVPQPCNTNEIVELRGTNLGDTRGTSVIRVGKRRYGPNAAKVLFWSNTEVRFQLPPFSAALPAGQTMQRNVWVVVGGVRSNKVPLTIYQP